MNIKKIIVCAAFLLHTQSYTMIPQIHSSLTIFNIPADNKTIPLNPTARILQQPSFIFSSIIHSLIRPLTQAEQTLCQRQREQIKATKALAISPINQMWQPKKKIPSTWKVVPLSIESKEIEYVDSNGATWIEKNGLKFQNWINQSYQNGKKSRKKSAQRKNQKPNTTSLKKLISTFKDGGIQTKASIVRNLAQDKNFHSLAALTNPLATYNAAWSVLLDPKNNTKMAVPANFTSNNENYPLVMNFIAQLPNLVSTQNGTTIINTTSIIELIKAAKKSAPTTQTGSLKTITDRHISSNALIAFSQQHPNYSSAVIASAATYAFIYGAPIAAPYLSALVTLIKAKSLLGPLAILLT